MKTCIICGQTKPLSDYYIRKKAKDGHRSDCKPCWKSMKARSVARIREIPKPIDESVLKTCTKCGQRKPMSDFHNHTGTRDGKRPDCKSCFQAVRKIRYEAKRPEILEKMREYNQTHTHELQESHRVAHQRRMQNHEWVEQVREKSRVYGQAHPDKRLERQRRRLERIANAPVNDFTRQKWYAMLEAYGNRCAYCGIHSLRLQTDHVIPLSRGGSHTASNIVPSCGPCNTKKGTGPAPPRCITPAFTVT